MPGDLEGQAGQLFGLQRLLRLQVRALFQQQVRQPQVAELLAGREGRPLFRCALQIEREALQAVILLREAFRVQEATLAMVEEVAGFLRRITIDPALRFEGSSWEDPGR